jgi:hypothetical protein
MLGYLRYSIYICGSRSEADLCLIRLQIRGSRLSVLVPTENEYPAFLRLLRLVHHLGTQLVVRHHFCLLGVCDHSHL